MRLNDFGIIVVIALVTALLLLDKPEPVAKAQPKTMVVLVPDAGGKVGAVSVKSAQGETVISNAYASATTTEIGRAHV